MAGIPIECHAIKRTCVFYPSFILYSKDAHSGSVFDRTNGLFSQSLDRPAHFLFFVREIHLTTALPNLNYEFTGYCVFDVIKEANPR